MNRLELGIARKEGLSIWSLGKKTEPHTTASKHCHTDAPQVLFIVRNLYTHTEGI